MLVKHDKEIFNTGYSRYDLELMKHLDRQNGTTTEVEIMGYDIVLKKYFTIKVPVNEIEF